MIELNIPGRGIVQLEHLVSDVNGTLALDGKLYEGLPRLIGRLKDRLEIHLLTAGTHGRLATVERQLNIKAHKVHQGEEGQQKATYIQSLGAAHVIALGQGANDALMLKEAAIGLCILSPEGTNTAALLAADIVVPDIFTALELLEKPMRLVATLRK